MLLSKLLEKMQKTANNAPLNYLPCSEDKKEYHYNYRARGEADGSYIQIYYFLDEDIEEDKKFDCHRMQLTIYKNRINTIDVILKDDWKWLYRLWLKNEPIEIDCKYEVIEHTARKRREMYDLL